VERRRAPSHDRRHARGGAPGRCRIDVAGAARGRRESDGTTAPGTRVRTIERTITIHKKAKPKPAVVQTIAASAPVAQAAPANASDASQSDDEGQDEFEGEDHEDEFEGEDHEGDDVEESEDHEDDGGSEDD
jgi:hypothetical protein